MRLWTEWLSEKSHLTVLVHLVAVLLNKSAMFAPSQSDVLHGLDPFSVDELIGNSFR